MKHARREIRQRLKAELLDLIQTKGSYANSEIKGYEQEDIQRVSDSLRRYQKVFAGRRGRRTVRFFSTSQAAKDWEDAVKVAGTTRKQVERGMWDAGAQDVFTARTRITYGPAPVERALRTNTYSQF